MKIILFVLFLVIELTKLLFNLCKMYFLIHAFGFLFLGSTHRHLWSCCAICVSPGH